MLIPPEILEKRFDKAKTLNQKILVKMLALKQLGIALGFFTNNPYTKGENPYEKELIELLISRMYITGMPSHIYVATAYLLDYYCPIWRECVEPKILGTIVSRNSKEYRQWVKDVYKRDSYTCQDCGSKENIQAHHIEPYSENIYLRVDIDNGVTLCGAYHSKEHTSIGFGMFVKINHDR
jgi:HNH endonuclease